jgi:hypothetical protein
MKLEFQRRDLVLFGANAALTIVLVLGLILGGGTTGPQGLSGTQGPSGPVGPIGNTGAQGEDGVDGEDGLTPYIGENGNWWVGETDTGVVADGQGGHQTQLDFDSLFTDFRLATAAENYQAFKTGDVAYVQSPSPSYASDLVSAGYIPINSATTFFTELSADTFGKKYVLTSDINFSNSEWDTLPSFEGILDGAGYALDGLHSDNFAGSNTVQMALFESIQRALIVNLTIKNFVIEQANLFEFNGQAGLFAGLIEFSTVANVQVVNNLYQASREIGLLAGFSYDSYFYDLNLNANTLIGFSNIGGVISYSERSNFVGIEVEDNQYQVVNGTAGGVLSIAFESVLIDVIVRSSTLTFLPLDMQFNPITDASLVVAKAYFSTLFQVSLIDGSIVFSDNPPQDGYMYPSAYNMGGIVGVGEEVILMNIVVEKENLDPFFDFRVLVRANVFEIEYMGGVAGFLTNYYLINVVNYAPVLVIDTLGIWANVSDVAGIVGYSSGSGYYHRVVNYGDIIGTSNVGGIVGGVGFAFVPAFGMLHFQQVANYGFILGNDYIGGLVGNLDGSTSISFDHVINHSLVIGDYAVGGLIGIVAISPQVGYLEIANAFVFGQVFGIHSVGGVLGEVYAFDGGNTLPKLSNILVYVEVEGMLLGLRDGLRVMGFQGMPNASPIYIGTVIGTRNFPVIANNVLAISRKITKKLFTFNENITDIILSEETITGYYNPLGFGVGAGFMSIPEDDDLFDVINFFLNQVIEQPSYFDRDDSVPFLTDFPVHDGFIRFDRSQKDFFFKPYILPAYNIILFPL